MSTTDLLNAVREAIVAQGRVFDNAHIIEEALGFTRVDGILAAISELGTFDADHWSDQDIENFLEVLGNQERDYVEDQAVCEEDWGTDLEE